jgi:outer membrane assembly lipoprotein YfiO
LTKQNEFDNIFAMKKIFILFFILFPLINTYPFWIWSPKQKKWKNPKHSALVTPYLQCRKALKYFKKKNYDLAYKEFKKLIIHYPDSEDAAEGQYFIGRCLEELKKPYQAFLEYDKLITSYPNSKRINEAVERMYKIGEYFLQRRPKKWMGISVYDFVEHPAIEIFRKIVEKSPYSPYASKSLYNLGVLLFQLQRFEEAKDAFQKLIDDYPDSQWVEPAKYYLAVATSEGSFGYEYDSSSVKEATKKLEEFLERNPQAKISYQAKEYLKELKDMQAKKEFEIASFYEKQKKIKSAIFYYRLILKNYPETEFAQKAKQKLKELKKKYERD